MKQVTRISEPSLGYHPPDVSTVRPVLMVFDRKQINQWHLIIQKQMVLGRDKEADIEVDDETISRAHAYIRYENIDRPAEKPYCTLSDANSRNGTFVNGREVTEPVALKHGDHIFIGSTCLVYFLRTEVEIFTDQRLRSLATTDPLTGLINRGYMAVQFDREFDRSKRYVRPLSLLMIDIDDFKKVNDTYGHQVGDGVLTQVAQAIKGSSRKHDIVARYGGEEFAVLLTETALHGATVIAERVRKQIANNDFQVGSITLNLSISIGISALDPVKPTSFENLLNQADQALLEAKRDGKNRFTVFNPNLETSE